MVWRKERRPSRRAPSWPCNSIIKREFSMQDEYLPADSAGVNFEQAIRQYIESTLATNAASPRQCVELACGDVLYIKSPETHTVAWTYIVQWLLSTLEESIDEGLGSDLMRIAVMFFPKVNLELVYSDTKLKSAFEDVVFKLARTTSLFPNVMALDSFKQLCLRFEKALLNRVLAISIALFYQTGNWAYAAGLCAAGPITSIHDCSIEDVVTAYYQMTVSCFNALQFERARRQLRNLATLLPLVEDYPTQWSIFGLSTVNDILNDDKLAKEAAISRQAGNSNDDKWIESVWHSFHNYDVVAVSRAFESRFKAADSTMFGLTREVYTSILNKARVDKIVECVASHSAVTVRQVAEWDLGPATLQKLGLPSTKELSLPGWKLEEDKFVKREQKDFSEKYDWLQIENARLVQSIKELQASPLVLSTQDRT